MMLLALFMGIFLISNNARAGVDVAFLTQAGPLNLKSWHDADLKAVAKRSGEISAQKLIFDESAQKLELNDRADVDLVTVYGDHKMARVPRFMIWRGFFKLQLNRDGTLSSKGDGNRLSVPSALFTVTKITKIELTRASILFPETELHLKTNPAASRGEKLFTQNCLACHGLPSTVKLKPEGLADAQLNGFAKNHLPLGVSLDAKGLRGLLAYRDALIAEHSEVKSKK
jgi:hypothetical protein